MASRVGMVKDRLKAYSKQILGLKTHYLQIFKVSAVLENKKQKETN